MLLMWRRARRPVGRCALSSTAAAAKTSETVAAALPAAVLKALVSTDAELCVVVEGNPKRQEAARRFERYRGATRCSEFLALGGLMRDLRNDLQKGFFTVGGYGSFRDHSLVMPAGDDDDGGDEARSSSTPTEVVVEGEDAAASPPPAATIPPSGDDDGAASSVVVVVVDDGDNIFPDASPRGVEGPPQPVRVSMSAVHALIEDEAPMEVVAAESLIGLERKAKFEAYRAATTCAEYVTLGGTAQWLRVDLKTGAVRLRGPLECSVDGDGVARIIGGSSSSAPTAPAPATSEEEEEEEKFGAGRGDASEEDGQLGASTRSSATEAKEGGAPHSAPPHDDGTPRASPPVAAKETTETDDWLAEFFPKYKKATETIEAAGASSSLSRKEVEKRTQPPPMMMMMKGSKPPPQASKSRAAVASWSEGEVDEEDDVGQLWYFDKANGYALVGADGDGVAGAAAERGLIGSPALVAIEDVSVLCDLVAPDICAVLGATSEDRSRLSDIVLDVGRRPYAWVGGERRWLGADERVVTREEIEGMIARVPAFGHDNRSGVDGALHRISAMRSRSGNEVLGLTLRVARHVEGNATMIADILLGTTLSVLFVSPPGCGKTTIIRDATRELATKQNVVVVDTSCEIGGPGNVPHACLGYARRMQVGSLDVQAMVMAECVQNHTPAVMVIDEIGRRAEVEAARTVKERGVRILASAHGSLDGIIRNSELSGLVGGVTTVTIGDAAARDLAARGGWGYQGGRAGQPATKTKTERKAAPIFDVVVELHPNQLDSWVVIPNVAHAVDDLILNGTYDEAQRRTRDAAAGGPVRIETIQLKSATQDDREQRDRRSALKKEKFDHNHHHQQQQHMNAGAFPLPPGPRPPGPRPQAARMTRPWHNIEEDADDDDDDDDGFHHGDASFRDFWAEEKEESPFAGSPPKKKKKKKKKKTTK